MTKEQTLQWLKNNKGWIDHHEIPDDVIDSCIEALTELEELKRDVKRSIELLMKDNQTAHEKLIEIGYEFIKRNDYTTYRHIDLPRVTIYRDKTCSCSDINLELSRILTKYLEEME